MPEQKKRVRKPRLTNTVKDKIRGEYFNKGATIPTLAEKYDRGTTTIHRIVNEIGKDGENLAQRLAKVKKEIKENKETKQELIIKRADEIEKIRDLALKGVGYVAGRVLRKLKGLKDNQVAFSDLNQAQNVITKADAIVNPKTNSINVNTQVNNVPLTKEQVVAELKKDGIPDDVIYESGFLKE